MNTQNLSTPCHSPSGSQPDPLLAASSSPSPSLPAQLAGRKDAHPPGDPFFHAPVAADGAGKCVTPLGSLISPGLGKPESQNSKLGPKKSDQNFETVFPRLHFTEADSEIANREWKATCGPHSIAAACGMTLNDVREAMARAGVNYRGWMSPTQVGKTLLALGRGYKLTSGLKTMALCNGINRVQWEGKWLNPGVPARVAYFQTHLVAHFDGLVLCTCCERAQWIPQDEWRAFHLNEEPPSPFHITHHYEMARPTP